MHTLETSRIVFHCNNGLKESCSLGMFHSCISILLVQVERLNVFWETSPRMFTNDSKTRISSAIKNRVRNKLVVYRSRWIIVKQLPLAGHNSTDHF